VGPSAAALVARWAKNGDSCIESFVNGMFEILDVLAVVRGRVDCPAIEDNVDILA
jgi:hypothetical protein